jgi:predicted small lipoprotein YifL
MAGMRKGAGVMLLALAACGQSGSADKPAADKVAKTAVAAGGDTAPYHAEMPLNEFMPHVMQYAGDGIWKRQGWRVDKTGEHSLFPKNDEEWEDAESGALTLAEVTNLLLLPGRRIAEPQWDSAVAGVRTVALKAAAAAEKKDADAFFAAGGELDEACDVCHIRYDPTFKGKPNSGG